MCDSILKFLAFRTAYDVLDEQSERLFDDLNG